MIQAYAMPSAQLKPPIELHYHSLARYRGLCQLPVTIHESNGATRLAGAAVVLVNFIIFLDNVYHVGVSHCPPKRIGVDNRSFSLT